MDDLYSETITVPGATRFPVELRPPTGFDPDEPETWPKVDGRLEFVEGRLLYMPPCGDAHQDTVADVVATLIAWIRAHPDFVLGSNEAGMRLGIDTRGADATIWRRADVAPYTGGFRRTPPILAVEVAGRDDNEAMLRDKSRGYLAHGVPTVWLVLPEAREVVVVTSAGESRHLAGDVLPEPAGPPGLSPRLDDFFVQISR